jgi:hypothetical protein
MFIFLFLLSLSLCNTRDNSGARISAKLSQLTPAQAASEMEMQKAIDAKMVLQQELIATKNELNTHTALRVNTLKQLTEYKRAVVVLENQNDEIKAQINALRWVVAGVLVFCIVVVVIVVGLTCV